VTSQDRNQLFAEALPIVKRAARRCSLSPQSADWEDALQVGQLALWRATERFDASRGIPFRGFAWQGVVGAIRTWLAAEHRASGVVDEPESITARPSERHVLAAPEVDDVEAELLDGITARRSRAALAKLPAPQRRVAEATLLRGRALVAYARRAGLPRTTCQWRLSAALSTLRIQCGSA
jgi:RNA polymerase sigma factor (sigma-70 family)